MEKKYAFKIRNAESQRVIAKLDTSAVDVIYLAQHLALSYREDCEIVWPETNENPAVILVSPEDAEYSADHSKFWPDIDS